MAGSMKWMVYTTDNGVEYAVHHDESNGETLGFGDYTALVDLTQLPKGIKMRKVHAIDTANSAHRRSFSIGSVDTVAYSTPNTTFSAAGTNWIATGTTGEAIRRPYHFDTALLDGDPD